MPNMNRQLCSGSKTIHDQVLTAEVQCPPRLETRDVKEKAHSLLMVRCWSLPLGSHRQQQHLETWNVFTEADLQSGVDSQKTDVLFDKYYEFSIKGRHRKWCGWEALAIRSMHESRDVPLPAKVEQPPRTLGKQDRPCMVPVAKVNLENTPRQIRCCCWWLHEWRECGKFLPWNWYI